MAAARGHTVTFVVGGVEVVVPWSQVHDEARAVAAALQARGVGPGHHVALLGPTSRELVTAVEAIWLAGATVVVLPLPMRLGSIEEFVDQTRLRIRNADISLVIADAELVPFMGAPEPDDPPLVDFDDIGPGPGAPTAADWVRVPDDLERIAILQFTSGSTADPKGVVLPERAVCANLDAIATAAGLDVDGDCLVSWLPLYHDMGLVGILGTAMTSGCRLVLGAPTDFMGSPGRWMEWMSTYGGTATAGPNFSYVLAARALNRSTETLDLSRVRIALNGAEPVDPSTVRAFVEAGARHGLRPGAIFPAFGMAEVAIAGTFPSPGEGMRLDSVDQRVLETERYARPVDPGVEGCRQLAAAGEGCAGPRDPRLRSR